VSIGGQSTPGLEVLSVAPEFGTGHVPFTGHEEVYQLGLSRAAAGVGIPWTILVPDAAETVGTPVVACLDPSSPESLVASLEAQLRERSQADGRTIGVFIYEGDTGIALAMATLAARHPHIRFLVNLFRSEAGLDAPLVRRKRYSTQEQLSAYSLSALARRLAPLGRSTWPANLRITAETDAKKLLARSVGVPVSDVWRLHSSVAERDASHCEQSSRGRHGGPVRVLVAVRSSRLHPPLVEEVLDVIARVGRVDGGQAVEWVMAGRFDDHPRVRRGLRLLGRAGVQLRIEDRPLDPDAYAEVFRAADAVWMPTVWPYRVQSSGKALDALVLGRPIIAPAGTFPASAMQRWIPGAPAYGSTTEAAQTFLRLPSMIGLLQSELDRQAAEIRAAYHPETTVRWLDEHLRRPSEVGGTERSAQTWALPAEPHRRESTEELGTVAHRARRAASSLWGPGSVPGAIRKALRERR
jgi:hypothetical protein